MTRIEVSDAAIKTLFGSLDDNLRHLESLLNVRIRTQGHELLVEGQPSDEAKVERIVGQLSSLVREGVAISNSDVKTASQLVAQDADVDQRDIVFGIGPAGTGKTYLAMAQAVSALLAKSVTRIVLARPAVEAGEKLGFLP